MEEGEAAEEEEDELAAEYCSKRIRYCWMMLLLITRILRKLWKIS